MSSDSAKGTSVCLALGRAAQPQKPKKLAQSKLSVLPPQIQITKYVDTSQKKWSQLPNSLMQSFNYSINAHFQPKSLAKVKVKVVPMLFAYFQVMPLLNRVRCEVFIYALYSRCYPCFVVASRWT